MLRKNTLKLRLVSLVILKQAIKAGFILAEEMCRKSVDTDKWRHWDIKGKEILNRYSEHHFEAKDKNQQWNSYFGKEKMQQVEADAEGFLLWNNGGN